ncbi:MAG: hypothetical protein Q9222_002179 [Ikaeria aurantiellina]
MEHPVPAGPAASLLNANTESIPQDPDNGNSIQNPTAPRSRPTSPYFVTYVNSTFFAVILVPFLAKRLWNFGHAWPVRGIWRWKESKYTRLDNGRSSAALPADSEHDPGRRDCFVEDGPKSHQLNAQASHDVSVSAEITGEAMTTQEIAWLSLEFSILWFVANYFTAACLNYTSVASSTILTATSSIWTLLLGALIGVETFSLKKLIGVVASFAGVVLTSVEDISGENDKVRGSFPHKSPRQISIGDALALLSAVLYGIYTTVMKKKIGDEARVNMPLFFGFVGLFNTVTLLPGFFILHFADIERFALPPTRRVWAIILVSQPF